MAKLVYNIEPASPSMISSLNRHCMTRTPDGASNIDPNRSKLNRVLEGFEHERDEDSENYGGGLVRTLKAFYASGIKKPAAQSEKPYLRIVLSASPEYFRPADPAAVGTWDEDRLAKWIEATMNQLREEHGADLIFAELHLDEDTPHIHAVVAPTYSKKARKPGKPKRGETPEQFEERKALAVASILASDGVRTVGRASHPTLSKQGSFQRLRERMTVAVDHLGIEYGEDRAINAPDSQSTREWVIQDAARLREERRKLEDDKAALKVREKAVAQTEKSIEIAMDNISASIARVQADKYGIEILAEDMPDEPTEFAVLQAAAPENRPTWDFKNLFWSLHFKNTGEPIPLPESVRNSITKAFDRVTSWAAEVRKGRIEAEKASRETTAAHDEARRLKDALEPLRAAVEAVEAWEAEKANDKWWDLTPDARLATKVAEQKAAIWAAASDDELKLLTAEVAQLHAETGTIICVESVDSEIGDITGEDLKTGQRVVARIVLDENERVEHYPSTQLTSVEAQRLKARKALKIIKGQIANVVAGSIVYLAGLKTNGSEQIAAAVPSCEPPRSDPRLSPPPIEAEVLLDLPDNTQAKVRQVLGTSSAISARPF